MKQIPLSKGRFALVDDEDFDELSKYTWSCLSRTDGQFYAKTDVPKHLRPFGVKRLSIYMHRLIMSAPPGLDVDHRDGNKLNNQRSNLRLCDRSENLANRGARLGNKSGYKGVWKLKGQRRVSERWAAEVMFRNQRQRLGTFSSAREAAVAYNRAALQLHGEFANLNNIKDSK